MVAPKVQQYSSKNLYPAFALFALCKGLNSGKPLEKPCANCFAILCRNAEEKEFYKSLLFGLWFSKAFHQILVGSAIEFIRINDFKQMIFDAAQRLEGNKEAFKKDVSKAAIYEKLQLQYLQTAALLADLRKAIIYRHLRSR